MSSGFFLNENGQKIITRGERLLCSPRNPQAEAQSWFRRQPIQSSDANLLLIGFGAGYHIELIQNNFPSLQLHILELDTEIKTDDFNLLRSVEDTYLLPIDLILFFRPAWAGLEMEYAEAAVACAQKSALSLRAATSVKGLIATSTLIHDDFKLSQIDFKGADAEELKVWRCLRELVV